MKKLKKLLLPILAAGFCITAPVGVLTATAEDSSAPWVTSPFEAGETKLTAHSAIVGDVATGLKASFPRSGSSVKLNKTQIGDFSMQYTPTAVGGKYSVDQLRVLLTEVDSGRELVIVADHAADQFSVSVVYADEQAGIYYNSSGKTVGLTTVGNAEGMYTIVNEGKTTLTFDADEMQILATGEGQTPKLVWDLTEEENDGKSIATAHAFGEYTVEIIAQGVEDVGEVVLYSVCGTDLGGFFIEESPVSVYSHVSRHAIKNVEYACPKGYASSLLGGVQEATLTVKQGANVIAENAQAFTPTATGTYNLEYAYAGVSKIYPVKVYNVRPTLEWTVEEDFSSAVVLGEVKNIPAIDVYGGLNVYGYERAKVTVYYNGSALSDYTDKESGFDFAFGKAGEYEIVYAANGEEIERFAISVLATTNVLQSSRLQKEYVLDQLIDISDVCANIGGQTVEGVVTVRFPSGKVYSNEKFVAAEVGKYAVTVTATLGETTYELVEYFEVISQPQGLLTTSDNLDISYGQSNFTRRTGVKITATASNQVFSYVNKVDLTKYEGITEMNDKGCIVVRDDVSPLIELSVDAAGYDVSAATGFTFNIVDATDENNYLTVTVNQYGGTTTWSYAKVSVCGKTPKGIGADGSEATRDILYYGKKIRVRSDNYGLITYHAFDSTTTGKFVATDSKIAIYYDHKEKQVLVPAGGDYHWVVMDLDDPLLCGSDIWGGFKGDEVYISGMMTGLKAAQASCYVYSVDGNNLENGRFAYDGKPSVVVDGGVTQIQSIKGKAISLPAAKAYDQYGNGLKEVTTKAYYKNGDRLIDVKIKEGKLATDKAGEYVVRYFAKDPFGNVGYRDLLVSVEETAPTLTVATNGMEDSGFIEAAVTDYAKVLPVENIVVTGAVNSYEIAVNVYFKDGENWDPIALESGEFYVNRYGEYKVEYTVVDFVGRTEKTSYILSAEKPTERIYADGKPVYNGFVSENTYEIFDLNVLDFEGDNNGVIVRADTYVNGSLFTQGKFTTEKLVQTLEGYQAKTVTIEYKLGNELLESYTVPVLPLFVEEEFTDSRGNTYKQTSYLVENYFVVEEDVSVKAAKSYSVLQSKGGKATFSYPLNADNLSFALDINETKTENLDPITTNVKAVTVRIQDVRRQNNYLEIVITNDETNADNKYAVAYCNGVAAADSLSGSLVGIARNAISLRYDNANRLLLDGNSGKQLFAFERNAAGEIFNGFDGEVYISFAIESADGEAASIRIQSLGGSIFAEMTATSNSPTITVNEKISGSAIVGEKLVVPAAQASDMFCDVQSVTVSVYDKASGKAVKNSAGVEMTNLPANVAYELTFTEVATYQVEYKAKNARGVESNTIYSVSCSSNEKPVITVKGDFVRSVKLNGNFTIASYNVQYQSQNENNLDFVVVINPRNRYALVKAGDAVTCDLVGKYVVRYYAADCYGNYQIKEYVIVCE